MKDMTPQEKLAALAEKWRKFANGKRTTEFGHGSANAYREVADELESILSEHGGGGEADHAGYLVDGSDFYYADFPRSEWGKHNSVVPLYLHPPTPSAPDRDAELEKLRELCGCAYQLAGFHDAPEAWLDALWDAADGIPLAEWRVQSDLTETLLPYTPSAPVGVEWHHPDCEGECLSCLIERRVLQEFGTQGLDWLMQRVAASTQEKGNG